MIEIQIECDRIGSLVIQPVSATVAGSYGCYLQDDSDIDWFLETYVPKCKRRKIELGWSTIILLDEWDYRHLVGGQSD